MQYGRSRLFNVPPKEHYDFLLVTNINLSHMSEILRRWSLWTVAWSLVSKN